MTEHADDHHGEVGHVVPVKLLMRTGLALIVLTVITVVAAQVDFAQWDLPEINIWVAMIIAGVKASLVCLFFMHLRWDRSFNSFILVGAIMLVVLFIGFALTDTLEYRVDRIDGDTPRVQQALTGLEQADVEITESGGGH